MLKKIFFISFLEANVKNTHLVMGWGRTNNKKNDAGDRFSGGAHSNILQQLEVPFVTNEMCRSNYKAFQNITRNKQICAGGIKGIYYNIFTTILFLVSLFNRVSNQSDFSLQISYEMKFQGKTHAKVIVVAH